MKTTAYKPKKSSYKKKKSTKITNKKLMESGDFTFFDYNSKSFGAFVKLKSGAEGRIYKSKKDNDGKYFIYFDGEPYSDMAVSHYDFKVQNYF